MADNHRVRLATAADAPEVARLLDDFNTEFDDHTPGVPFLTKRLATLLDDGELTVLLGGGTPPTGFATLRFRQATTAEGLGAYLEELYVAPDRRGEGLGRALLEAAMETARNAGAVWIELATADDDVAARRLYESVGFTNFENPPDRAQMLFYERAL